MNRLIFSLLLSSLFLLTSCNRAIIPPVEDKLETVAIQRIVLLLKPGVAPEVIEPVYERFSLLHKNRVNKEENRWVYTFDGNKITAAEILVILIDNSNVEEANFYDLTDT
jgi:hypothetical protein